MFRKASVAALSAALIFATSPSFACTGISLKADDGAAIRGRTLEFGFPMQSNVLVVPAGKYASRRRQEPDHTSKYAVVGANALGLSMA
ncbi:MAG TPA: linear amide C-N hydrolase, partial [Methyloceanibacter sp.]|nr:linear amide C-N hydrolase [Methyloceanibacter sp.]